MIVTLRVLAASLALAAARAAPPAARLTSSHEKRSQCFEM
jgi:hypothetical protein